jgi:hypothetical protein
MGPLRSLSHLPAARFGKVSGCRPYYTRAPLAIASHAGMAIVPDGLH